MNKFDELIIKKIKNKNEEGIKYLLTQYGGLIKSIAAKNLYQYESHIDECINDVLLAVWNNINSYDESKNSFKNWIGVIAKYHSIDILRKYSKEALYTAEQAHEKGKDDYSEFIYLELWNELIQPLSEEDQMIMTKIFIEGFNADEVAQQMNKKTSNIYNRVSRAKNKIRVSKGESS